MRVLSTVRKGHNEQFQKGVMHDDCYKKKVIDERWNFAKEQI